MHLNDLHIKRNEVLETEAGFQEARSTPTSPMRRPRSLPEGGDRQGFEARRALRPLVGAGPGENADASRAAFDR